MVNVGKRGLSRLREEAWEESGQLLRHQMGRAPRSYHVRLGESHQMARLLGHNALAKA